MTDQPKPCIRCGGTGQEPERRVTNTPTLPRPQERRITNTGHSPERRVQDRRGKRA